MAHLSGVFDKFPNLDKIPIERIVTWIKTKYHTESLQNFLGNRLIYPQTIAISKTDLEIDLAILKEAIRDNPELLYNRVSKKIFIPTDFIARFPPINKLIISITESLHLDKGITTILWRQQLKTTSLGSIYVPSKKINSIFKIIVNNKVYTFNQKGLILLPIKEDRLILNTDADKNLIARGGEAGLILDLRPQV